MASDTGRSAREFSDAFRSALGLYREFAVNGWGDIEPEVKASLLADLTRQFERLYLRWAEGLADAMKDEGWSADERNAGYLVKGFGQMTLHVPFNLVVGLPKKVALGELLKYAQRLRASEQTVVCLSGSAVSWTTGAEPNDLDFCEYVQAEPEIRMDLTTIGSHAVAQEASDLSWLHLRTYNAPGRVLKRGQTNEEIDAYISSLSDKGKLFCSFVTKSGSWGVIEVTKLSLTPSRFDDSFTAQEAPVTEGNWVPRVLLNPDELHRYARFLREAVSTAETTGHLLKGARRIVALARLLLFRDIADRAQRFLASRGVRGSLQSRVRLLDELNNNFPISELEHYKSELTRQIREIISPGRAPAELESEEAYMISRRPFEFSDDDRREFSQLVQLLDARLNNPSSVSGGN